MSATDNPLGIDLRSLGREGLKALAADVKTSRDAKAAEVHLSQFVRQAWHILEPGRDLLWNWHLDVLCAYLEAVHRREIKRLIINIPPGTMKSLIVNVFFPAWEWIRDPTHRFLCGSNEGTLATRDSLKMRRLVGDPWYQRNWGGKVKLSTEQAEKTLFANTAHGHRESQGVLAKITGKRGDTVIWDDAHDTKQVESDVQRNAVLRAWDDAWSSRLNDPDSSAVIMIMQRIHDEDITGYILKNKPEQGWVHLAIPMRFDPEVTYDAEKDIGRPDLNDPRRVEGELMFAERFSETAVRNLETDLGPYGSAGQLQQRPAPKGGGELRREWLGFYKAPPRGGNRIIIVDPAGERKPGQTGPRDNTAMGVFEIGEDGNYYLIDGYRDRLNLVERSDILFKWHRQYKPSRVGYESYGMQADIPHLQDRMERDGYRFKIWELKGSLKKQDRIRRLIPLLASGRIWLPETLMRTLHDGRTVDVINHFIEIEYLPFPVAKFDDFLDMMSRLMDEDMQSVGPPGGNSSRVLNFRTPRIHDSAVGY